MLDQLETYNLGGGGGGVFLKYRIKIYGGGGGGGQLLAGLRDNVIILYKWAFLFFVFQDWKLFPME